MDRKIITLLALAVGCVAAVGAFVAAFELVATAPNCPPASVCDGPFYAGIGAGLLAAPIVGFAAGWLVVRVMSRPRERL